MKERIVCESYIDGEFKGWEGNTAYRLQNGQEWKQYSYEYYYYYEYSPRVKIIDENGALVMYVGSNSHGCRVVKVSG